MPISSWWPSKEAGRPSATSAVWVMLGVLLLLLPLRARGQSATPEEELKFAQKLFGDGLYSIAAVQYRTFAQRFPRDPRAPEALFRASEAMIAAGSYKDAVQVLRDLQLTYPKSNWNDQALLRLSHSYLALQDTSAAVAALERLAYLYPSSPLVPEALLRSAELYIRMGKPGLARRRLGDLIDNYPERPEKALAYLRLGQALLAQDDLRTALVQFQKAIDASAQPEVTAEALWFKGKVYEGLGQTAEAEAAYQSVIEKFPAGRPAIRARVSLGDLARQRGDYDAALTYFTEVKADSLAPAEAMDVLLRLGRLQMEKGSYAAALETFRRGLSRKPTGLARCRLAFEAAAAAEKLADPGTALKIYQQVVDDTTLGASLANWQAQAWIEIARLQAAAGQARPALAALARVVQDFPKSAAAEEARFQRAKILAEGLQDYPEAIRVLGRFIDDYPTSRNVDDARYLLAESYERQGQYDMALAEYRRYLRSYPAGDRIDQARERVRILERVVADRWQSRLADVLGTLPQVASGGDGQELSYQLGRFFYELRDFAHAIQYFRSALSAGYDVPRGPEALYYLGRSYYGLAQKRILFGDGANAAALVDSARVALAYVKDHFSDTDSAAEAAYLLLDWDLRQKRDPASRRALLQGALDEWRARYSANPHLFDIAQMLADDLVAHAEPGDTLAWQQAIELYGMVKTGGKGGDLLDAATIGEAKAYLLAGDTAQAVVRLDSLIARRDRSPVGPEALMLRARVAIRRGKPKVALALYEEIEKRFFYSPLADSARTKKASLLLRLQRYSEVTALAPRFLSDSTPDRLHRKPDADLLLTFAAAYDSLGQGARATTLYLRYLREFPSDPRRNRVLLTLGKLARKRNAWKLAKSYYSELLRVAPGTEEALQAEFAIADIAYQRKEYRQARTLYLELMKKAGEDRLRERAAARAILCLYRLGEVSAADGEARSYKSRFPNTREQQAEFLYEKGEYYIRQKNFVRAEKVFKSLSKRYKGTEHAALGELGLGRIYIITTKTDAALDVLTRLVERYPDTRAAALALLNLGDFYRLNGQIDNAISSLKRVVNHPKAGDAADTATRYLIQLYDQVNLNDQALALARKYLEDHPDDPKSENLQIKIGTLLMEQKDYEAALRHFRRLKNLVRGEVETEVQYYIGEALMNLGRYDDAVLEYLKVEYLSPPSKLPWKVTALYQAGIALTRLKRFDRAKEIFHRIVLSQGASSDFGRIAQARIEEIDRKLMSEAGAPK